MKWLDALKTVLLMNCREAAPLIAEAMEQKLAVQDRVAVRLHLAICGSCRRYRGQLSLLRRVLMLIGSTRVSSDQSQLSADARARIRFGLEHSN